MGQEGKPGESCLVLVERGPRCRAQMEGGGAEFERLAGGTDISQNLLE